MSTFDYSSFEDYWSSFSIGPTRIAQRLTALPAELRLRCRNRASPKFIH
jgi:hypothetical protein